MLAKERPGTEQSYGVSVVECKAREDGVRRCGWEWAITVQLGVAWWAADTTKGR